jgi:hypothetical protein
MKGLRCRSRVLILTVIGALGLPTIGLNSSALADTTTHTPKAGECFALSKSQVQARAWPKKARAIDCSEPHTAEVAKAIDVPSAVARFGLESREVGVWIGEECAIAVNRYAGAKRPKTEPESSTTKLWTFRPSAKEWNSGGRSVTCVAGSVKPRYNVKKKGWQLNEVTGSTRGKIGKPLQDVRKSDGSTTYSTHVARTMLATSVTQPYPGEDRLLQLAARKQRKLFASEEGYVWTVPTAEDWEAGQVWTFYWFVVTFLP